MMVIPIHLKLNRYEKLNLITIFIILLGFTFIYLYIINNDILFAIFGATFICSGILSYLNNMKMNEIMSFFPSPIRYQHRLAVYESRGELLRELSDSFRYARRTIDIMSTDSISLLWTDRFSEEITDLLHKGVRIRIIFFGQDCMTREGLPGENQNEEQKAIRQHWLNFYKHIISSASKRSAQNLQIRTYAGPSILFLMLVDNHVFFSPYLRSESPTSSLVFEVESLEERIFKNFASHFMAIWERSIDISGY